MGIEYSMLHSIDKLEVLIYTEASWNQRTQVNTLVCNGGPHEQQ